MGKCTVYGTAKEVVYRKKCIWKRKKLNNRSPYETFSFYYGEDILKKLGCKPVAAENIILKPKLLKK